MSAGSLSHPVTDTPHMAGRTCEWCGSPMTHDGRAVCPSCGRLASRLAAMDEPDAPDGGVEAIDDTEAIEELEAAIEDQVTPPPPPPPPAPQTAQPAPPAPPAAGPTPRRRATGDGPVAPGDAWPTPAPLPPDEAARPWWKVAVPVAVVVVLLGLAAVFVLGGGDGGSEASSSGSDKVDLSDIDDPADTTTRPPTTTTEVPTVTTPDGRVVAESPSGIAWSMATEPEVDDLSASGSSGAEGQVWQAEVDATTTEVVEVVDASSDGFDSAKAIEAFAERMDGTVANVEESHIAEAPGTTASFTATVDGKDVVGYVVAAPVGDEGLIVSMFREGDDLDGLYLDWLALPSSVTLP